MLKIPSLAPTPKNPGPFADKYEEEAFWQLNKKQGGGYISMTEIRNLASKLRSSAPIVIVPPLIVPSVIIPSIVLPSIRVPKL